MAFNLFLTSTVSKICCFSEIVAVMCEAILSAICEGSFNKGRSTDLLLQQARNSYNNKACDF